MTLNAIGLFLLLGGHGCYSSPELGSVAPPVPARRVFHSMSYNSLRWGRYACYQTKTSMGHCHVQGLVGESTYLVVLQSYYKQCGWEVVLFPFFHWPIPCGNYKALVPTTYHLNTSFVPLQCKFDKYFALHTSAGRKKKWHFCFSDVLSFPLFCFGL